MLRAPARRSREMTKLRREAITWAPADAAAILIESPVANPVQTIFDFPVTPVEGQQACRIHERLGKSDRMPVAAFPVLTQTSEIESQNLRGEVRTMPGGQNQKTHIVDHQAQTTKFQRRRPADPGITRRTLQGRRAPTQQRHPLFIGGGHIPERSSDDRPESQVVVGLHQFAPGRSLLAAHGADDEPARIGETAGGFSHGRGLPNPP